MATSKLVLYQTKLTPSKNYMLDDIRTYLRYATHLDINNFQYQKIEIDMRVKIEMAQDKIHELGYNYAVINEDEYNYYFFITDLKWKATNTIELTLSMDTIHTFQYQITNHFTDKTKIVRQHKDRFVYDARALANNIYLSRKVDEVDEGVSGAVKKGYTYEITPDNNELKGTKWYLIYRNSTDQENSPVNCYLCASKKLSLLPTISIGLPVSLCEIGRWYMISTIDGDTEFYINGHIYINASLGFRILNSNGDVECKVYDAYNNLIRQRDRGSYIQSSTDNCYIVKCAKLKKSNITGTPGYDIPFADYNGWTNITYTGLGSQNNVVNAITDLDRTDSKLIKIIELPYCPVRNAFESNAWFFDEVFVYDTTTKFLKLTDLHTEFSAIIKADYDIPKANVLLPSIANRKSLLKSNEYESKLYHSDFFNWKFAYDSFSKTFAMERLDMLNTQYDTFPGVEITFSAANTITSNMAFKFNFLNSTYRQVDDFEPYLVANRNNESPIYNSSYLNYIRNGYNYDKKNKVQQDVFNWIGTGLQIAGAAVGFATSAYTGGISTAAGISLAVSATASIASNINTTVSNERNIAQKINETKNQSVSIQTSDDLSILHFYNGQCLRYGYYSVSDNLKSVLFDLFHYCGYADGRQAIPDYNSRRCFNFIQCEPIFDNEDDSIWIKYIDDVKARFSAGITVLHKFYNGTSTNYDFEQKYENFETWICPREA